MLWYYMYPSTDGVTDLPFYVLSIGLHELQPQTIWTLPYLTALREVQLQPLLQKR